MKCFSLLLMLRAANDNLHTSFVCLFVCFTVYPVPTKETESEEEKKEKKLAKNA